MGRIPAKRRDKGDNASIGSVSLCCSLFIEYETIDAWMDALSSSIFLFSNFTLIRIGNLQIVWLVADVQSFGLLANQNVGIAPIISGLPVMNDNYIQFCAWKVQAADDWSFSC
jgi:hypothetical protein